ncbi:MAG TPA: DUF4232 domain-containing protein [Gaiellaceae bacterium]|nr:DUF4232 domain-containing protein [Gaiellaceae bacterium]
MVTLGRLGLLVAAVAVVTSPAAGAMRTDVPCTGAMLSGSFKAIPGSAGAGNIVYRLQLENISSTACFTTGVPGVLLLDARGGRLPTHGAFAGKPGVLTAVMVPLFPGKSATLTARFSPDVPGRGEPVLKHACEPTAYRLRVTPAGGGTVVVPISPPTPVCEHGSLQLTSFVAG